MGHRLARRLLLTIASGTSVALAWGCHSPATIALDAGFDGAALDARGEGMALDAGFEGVTLDIDLSAALERPRRIGFTYFGAADAPLPAELVDPLRTSALRTTIYADTGTLRFFQRYPARVTYVVGDAFRNRPGAPPGSQPWDDWTIYEDFVRALVVSSRRAEYPVAYWDVWNEPDNTWMGTREQLFELISRTAAVIRDEDPAARIVAPSVATLDATTLEQALTAIEILAERGTHLDAFSWHELDDPLRIPRHAARAREFFAAHPRICDPACPELHVNEWSGGQHDHVPGWHLAYLAELDRADVNWASKACWQIPLAGEADQSGCGYGLGGLLSFEGNSTRPTYWVERSYAELDRRAPILSPDRSWSGLGGVRADGTVGVLVGRRSCGALGRWCEFVDRHVSDDPESPPLQARIVIRGLAWSSAEVVIRRIPLLPPEAPRSIPGRGLLAAPETVRTGDIHIVAGVAAIDIGWVADGEVSVISLAPAEL